MPDELPRKTEKPWGYELLFARTPKYAGKVMFVKKGHRPSLQFHRIKDETMYVFQGKLLVELEKDGQMVAEEAPAGRRIHIPTLTKHRITALEDTFIFEVSTPELEDVVRIQDDYGRAEAK